MSAQVIELEGHLEGGGREVDGRGDRILWERPDMMSALEGGGGSWKSGHSKGGCVNFIQQIKQM